ncbi:Uncharacterised protein [uncultured Clostridium sp.]|uniref:hypothetical protein n=1 Tax=uncultured Clostridium sp. TaxID=59620 RepID=UPI000821D054|nr:hypothetical protein [uncultured Clostridium sp.]SCJ00306.1 Uncharacterised protein [uncultured Clostridium sp.]
MEEVLKYVSVDTYDEAKNKMKNGDVLKVFSNEELEIELMKIGKKVFNVITRYGDKQIDDIVKGVLIQA